MTEFGPTIGLVWAKDKDLFVQRIGEQVASGNSLRLNWFEMRIRGILRRNTWKIETVACYKVPTLINEKNKIK